MYLLLLLGWSAVALAPVVCALEAQGAWSEDPVDLLERAPQLLFVRLVGRLRVAIVLVPVGIVVLHSSVVNAAHTSASQALPMLQTAAALTPTRTFTRLGLVAIGLVWCAGVLRAFSLALFALVRERRLRRESSTASDALTIRLRNATTRLGLSHAVVLREAHVDSPMVVGRRAPVILVPRTVWCTSDDHTDALLLHELAHVVRGDARTNLWLVAASALLWWHPSVRRLTRAARAAREFACDDIAAAALGSPASLAGALVALAESRDGTPPVLLSLAADGHPLVGRVRRLMHGTAGQTIVVGPQRRVSVRQVLQHSVALAVGVGVTMGAREHNDTQRAFAESLIAPATALTIEAHDDAGPFRVIMRRGRVEGVIIDRDSVTAPRLVARGDSLSVSDATGRRVLTLAVDPRGVIAWTSRRRLGAPATP